MATSAVQELKDTNNILQAVFDSAPNGIAVMQTLYNEAGKVEDFSILLFNAYTLNWIGDIDYKGKRYGDVFPMVKETGILEAFITVAETGITANFERFYPGEGMRHWFRFTAVKQGELLVVTTEDITAAKKAEASLNDAALSSQKQQRLYEAVTNNTPDLVYVFDLNYRFTYANKALLSMWGRNWNDSIGKGLRDLGYEEWHAQMHEREIDEVVATKKSIRGTVSFPHAELGKRIYDYIFAPVFNEMGNVEGIAGTTRDITDIKGTEQALKESEGRFRTMVEQAQVPIGMTRGREMVFEAINDAMLEVIGRTGMNVLQKSVAEVLPELEGQTLMEILHRVWDSGQPFKGNEVLANLQIGGKPVTKYYDLSYTPVAEDGKMQYIIHLALDVTQQVMARQKIEEVVAQRTKELGQANETLQKINKELQRSNANLEEFAHAASHDLKEPVRKIYFFTNQLKEQLKAHLEENQARAFNRIENATERMGNLIDDLLLYSHVSHRPHETETIDLNREVQRVLEDLELDVEEKKAFVHVEKLPAVKGYRRQLQQLFQNLIGNALKYSKADVAPNIHITANEILDDGKLYHLIAIQDNGIGFEPEYREKIFQMFTRLHGKTEYSGTGVGLSIVKKVIENHNGFIQADSVSGEGSVFKIYLPVQN